MKENFNPQENKENEKVEKITIESFSKYLKNVEEVPELVQKYLDAPSKVDGENFKIVVGGKSENTGYGMSYYSDYKIIDSAGKELFNSGMRLYRSGLPNAQDHWEYNINEMKIIEENSKELTYGWRGGTGSINVEKYKEKSGIKKLENFDLAAREKALENQNEPADEKAFEKWVNNYVNTDRASADTYYKDENICVSIVRHANQPFNATHDWYRLFAWLKGKGVAVGGKKYTRGGSASFGSSNYFRPTITINGDKIELKGRSENGDVNITETYLLSDLDKKE